MGGTGVVGSGGIFVGASTGGLVGRGVLVAAGVRVGVAGAIVVAGGTGVAVTVLVGMGVAVVSEAVPERVVVWAGVFWVVVAVGVVVEALNRPKTSIPNRYPTANMAAQPRMTNIRNSGP